MAVIMERRSTPPRRVRRRVAAPAAGMIRLAMEEPGLAKRLLEGDRRALARAITLVEDGEQAGAELVAEVYPHTGRASIVGFTGPPGAGKSTLIAALTARRRRLGRQIGVLSVDPSSPYSGGAVLGDRIRLAEHFLDGGVFIRSMATRGALGGLARAAAQAALLMDAAGREEVYVETVGVGQGEIDIVDHADTVVLVLVPGSGDSIQALKAGVMEIPDVIVVNKADMVQSDALLRDVRGVLALAPQGEGGWQVPVLATDARSGEGVDALEAALLSHRAQIEASGELAQRRRRHLRAEVIALASASWREELERRLVADGAFEGLLDEVVARRLDPASAARELSRDAGA
jgi:LAO/AO transport system kinase